MSRQYTTRSQPLIGNAVLVEQICFLEVQQQGCGTTLKPMTASQKLRCRSLRRRFWDASLGLKLVLGNI